MDDRVGRVDELCERSEGDEYSFRGGTGGGGEGCGAAVGWGGADEEGGGGFGHCGTADSALGGVGGGGERGGGDGAVGEGYEVDGHAVLLCEGEVRVCAGEERVDEGGGRGGVVGRRGGDVFVGDGHVCHEGVGVVLVDGFQEVEVVCARGTLRASCGEVVLGGRVALAEGGLAPGAAVGGRVAAVAVRAAAIALLVAFAREGEVVVLRAAGAVGCVDELAVPVTVGGGGLGFGSG